MKRKKSKFTVTSDPNHMAGVKRQMTWPEFAADIFPRLQQTYPELRDITLAEFIEHCPVKIECVVPAEGEPSK